MLNHFKAKSVEHNITSEWLNNIQLDLRQPYKDEAIFNIDETGVFYKLTLDKKFQLKNVLEGNFRNKR